MSTLKADAVTATTTNGDLALSGNGTGVPDIEAGFKVGGTAGLPINNLRVGTDGELITWDASGDPAAVGVGTATHVLTSNGAGAAPTFQAAAAGGAFTSITNTAITATTNIDFTGFASGTYDNYEIWISNALPASSGAILYMLTSTDGGTSFDTGASDYTWTGLAVREDASIAGAADADDSEIKVTLNVAGVGGGANDGTSLKINIFGPETTAFTTFSFTGKIRAAGTPILFFTGVADRQSAADVDAIRFHWATGDWIAQGKIQFLGIAQ